MEPAGLRLTKMIILNRMRRCREGGDVNFAAFTVSLIDHSLAELAERVETMPLANLQTELEQIVAGGRSATCDLVAAILAREIERRDQEARS